MTAKKQNLIRLKAQDVGDVMVVAALVQDGILRVRDLKYLPKEGRFAGVINRFKWEDLPRDAQGGVSAEAIATAEEIGSDQDASFADADPDQNHLARQHMGFCFEQVEAVSSKNIPSEKDAFLTLLTITAKDTEAVLRFAGDCALRIKYRKLALFVEDLGEAWPTFYLPTHSSE